MKKLFFFISLISVLFAKAQTATYAMQSAQLNTAVATYTAIGAMNATATANYTTAIANYTTAIANYTTAVANYTTVLASYVAIRDSVIAISRRINEDLTGPFNSKAGTLLYSIESTNQTQVNSLAAISSLLSSGNLSVSAGGYTKKITGAVTTNTVTYSASDNIGGTQTITTAVRTSSGTAILNDIEVWSTESQTIGLVVDFWSASPTGTFTNNSAQVIADPTSWLGQVVINGGDFVTLGSGATGISRATLSGLGISIKADTGTSIYATIYTTGAPAWTTSTTGMTIKYGILQD